LALLYLAWVIRKRFGCEPLLVALQEDLVFLRRYARPTVGIFLFVAVAIVAAYLFIPPYWELKYPPALVELKQGQTEDGAPWIGAVDPLVTIVEFSDYQCFQCRKMHFYLRELISKHPDAIRLVHRHYPMDHEFNFIVQDPFHVGSGSMALLAIHAEAHGNFWEMNDLLYRLAGGGRNIDLRQIADETGLELAGLASALKHTGYRKRLEIDIRHGMKVRALGTPSYLIDGQLHQGTIPSEVLSAAVKR
jgi:protein-disulfide isomerase